MKSSSENVKRLKGDGLRVNMDLNDLNLKVSGDGCRVTVERNCGRIRVYGDGCSLKVNCNDGDIEYKGDGGSIFLGGGSRTESVSYVGDGGRISVQQKSGEKIGVKSARSVKRSGKKKTSNNEEEKVKPYCSSFSDSELEVKLDNLANENAEEKRREKSRNVYNKNNLSTINNGDDIIKEKNLRRSKTIVVTNITSDEIPVNINRNSLIKNLFRSPPTVIKSFKYSGPESL